MTTAKVLIRQPKRTFLLPDVTFYISAPWTGKLGPISLREPFAFELPAPRGYGLQGPLAPGFEIDVTFTTEPGTTTMLKIADGLSLWQRIILEKPAEPQMLFLRRRTAHLSHFWIGRCESDARLGALLSEAAYWAIEDDDARDEAPLSEFTASQGESWCDHDFLEAGWETKGRTIAERFGAYSWCVQWAAALETRAADLGVADPNSFIMLGGDPDRPEDWRMTAPRDITAEGVDLKYAGEIRFYFD